MDMPLIPADRRAMAVRAYAKSFDAVAWRAPTARRFDTAPANDHIRAEVARDHPLMPRWIVIVGGAVVALITGAFLGGMLAV